MTITWNPPVSEKKEEEKRKVTWTLPKPFVLAKPTWQPPKPEPEPIDLSKYVQQGYDEPTWMDIMFHATKAGVADLQTSFLNLGRIMYETSSQVTDKITDIFDKDIYDPKKDSLRKWLGELVSKSEAVSDESWEQTISKNRIKNLVALVGRAIPLSLITLLSGGALAGAYPGIAMKIGSLPTALLPFAASATGSHARRIEKGFEARSQEAPFAAVLFGGVMGAMGEVATEAIPFQRWLNIFGGSRVINRGAKSFLAKYGKLGIDWAVGAATETLQEVAMVPIEKSINNLLFHEKETLFPKEEMIQAGMVGFGLSVVLGGLGASSSALRSFSEDRVDKMLKLTLEKREGTYDIAEKMIDESEPDIPITDEDTLAIIAKNEGPIMVNTIERLWEGGFNTVESSMGGKGTFDALQRTDYTKKNTYITTGKELDAETITELKKAGFYVNKKRAQIEVGIDDWDTQDVHEIIFVSEVGGAEWVDAVNKQRLDSMADILLHKKEYLADEPTVKDTPQEEFVRKNVHKVVPRFPRSEWNVTDQRSLKKLGYGVADTVGLGDLNIIWQLGKTNRRALSGSHKLEGNLHTIKIRMPSLDVRPYEKQTYRYKDSDKLLGGQERSPSHGNLVKIILHELGHIAVPPVKGVRRRRVHTYEFNTWTEDNRGRLWIETTEQTPADTTAAKELLKLDLKKARVAEKFGLDPKDFKYTTLPKGKIEVVPVEEDVDEIMKELKEAGFGVEKPVEKEPTDKELLAEKEKLLEVNDEKVKLHIMQKDEFVKRMMKDKSLEMTEQLVSESIQDSIDGETPALPTKEGVTLSGKMQEYMKMLRSSLILDPSAKNVYTALAEMDGIVAEAEYVSQQVRDTWEKMVPSVEDETLIDKYADMPDKYQAEITKRGLQNEADWLIRQYERLADVALKAGVIGGVWRNYSPFLFKNIHEWMNINKDADTPVAGILGTRFAHGIERNLQNYDAAEALGLIPEHRVGLKLSAYMYSLSKVVAHRNFVDIVRNMTDENGHAVATELDSREEWARNYRQVGNPEFAQYVLTKDKRGRMKRIPIRWKPEVAEAIEEIAVPAWMQSKPMRNIRLIKGIVKRIIFLNPAIHGWNIFSDVLDEVDFNFFKAFDAIRPGGAGAKLYLGKTALVREALRANLNLTHTGRLGRRIREEIYDLIPIEGKNVITKGIGKLFAWNDNVLWTTIVRNAQIYTYALKRTQGLTPIQSASFTNDLLGTLPKRYFTNFEWGVSTTFFLARNWTISNLRLLTGALGPMSNIIPIKALTRREMSPADMKALAPHYIRHLIKGMFGLIMLTNILNKLFTGKWAFENEPGHKLDLRWGTAKDNKGRDIYIVMPLLRYMRDYLGWITQPRRTLWNKMEPVLKTSLELLINRSLWQNRAIMHPEAPFLEKIKDAAEYALWSWTPFDQFLDSENEVKTRLQKLMYFTGTWVRRGSSISSHSYNTLRTEEKVEFVRTLSPKLVNELFGNLAIGRIYGEVANKLYKFRSQKGYVKEKLDASIDKLLTGGDIPGAIELMIESGRYKNMSSIKDRIMPYLMLRNK